MTLLNFESFFTFWHKMFLVHLGPSPRISYFSKNLQFPLMDNWMRGHNPDVRGCTLRAFLQTELGKTVFVCVCVYECICAYMYIRSEVKVTQSCLTLGDPVNYRIHGILQVRILEWVAIPFSRGSSWPRNRNRADSLPAELPGNPVSLLTLQFNSISFNHIIVSYLKMMTSEGIKMIIQLF